MNRILAAALVAGLAGAAGADTIFFDQIGASSNQDGNGARASQVFESSFAAFHIGAIDDFTTTQSWTLTEAAGAFLGAQAGLTSFTGIQFWRVAIYSSAAAAQSSLVGDVFNYEGAGVIDTAPWTSDTRSALVTVDVSSANFSLPAGTYWMAMMARLDFNPGAHQVYVYDTDIAGGLNAQQANPGAGFGFTLQPTASDLAYRLSAVPAPSAAALLGLAGLASARRRRA